MDGGSNSTSCMNMMAFGDNSNGLYCPMMMMPLMSSFTHQHHRHDHHHDEHHQHHLDADSNTLFLPLAAAATTTINNIVPNQNRNSSSGSSLILEDNTTATATAINTINNSSARCYFMETNYGSGASSSVKAKIMAHPHYHRLLAAYANCQKVGAPPEVVARLEEVCASAASMGSGGSSCIGQDPALDQFMEAYCEMLTKYEQELSKPFKEAMSFLQKIESQFKSLSISSPNSGDSIISSYFHR